MVGKAGGGHMKGTLDGLNMSLFDDLFNGVADSLTNVYDDGGRRGLKQLLIDDDDIFDLVAQDALDWAKGRAAELVGKKWIDGKLVDNPNPKWSITEATRDGIKGMIEEAYSAGSSPAELAKNLEGSYSFSKYRAKLVAKTETAKASVSGTLNGWKRSGLVEGKSSLLSDDHDGDDECDENEDDGVIPIDEDFSSGDDGPPYHPGCNCTLVAELLDDEEDEKDE